MPTDKEIEEATQAVIDLYRTCDSYAPEIAKAALEAAEKVRGKDSPAIPAITITLPELTISQNEDSAIDIIDGSNDSIITQKQYPPITAYL